MKRQRTIRQHIAITFAIIFLGTALQAQPEKSIIVGAVYNIFHEESPSDSEFFARVDRDITLMKSSHINHVLLFPMGQWDTRTKALTWGRTDYLVRRIEQTNMQFAPILLKEEQANHYVPIWRFQEVPGLWQKHESRDGNRNTRQNIDFADPGVAPLVRDYIQKVIHRYGKSPALSFYNVWNEPHYSSTSDHVVIRFRSWLQTKYGGLDALNRSWGDEYTAWEQVTPFLNDNWNSSMPWIDWLTFRNELQGTLLGELAGYVRELDTLHPVTANPVGTPWTSFGSFEGYDIDPWVLTSFEQIAGVSFYPDGWERAHNLAPFPFWLQSLTFTTIRSAAAPRDYILTEVYTNAQNGLVLNGYLDSSDVALLAWNALANDCKGLMYWKWEPFYRGRQSLGRGLCRVDGTLSPRGEAVRDLGAVVQRYGPLFYRARLAAPRAAILCDMTGLLKTLEQTTEPATRTFMYESIAGTFKALHDANLTVDILRADRPLDREMLKRYRIIFLPFQIVMRRQVAALLEDYVQSGGWLVADARTATLDEQDFAYKISPGAGLDELFGATRSDWIGAKSDFEVEMNGWSDPVRFRGKYFREFLKADPTSAVAGRFTADGKPALLEHRVGHGMAVLSAVPLGASYYAGQDNRAGRVLQVYASRAGADPPAVFRSQDGRFVETRTHDLGDSSLVYIINPEDSPASGTLAIHTGGKRYTQAMNLLDGSRFDLSSQLDSLRIALSLRAKGVAVLLLKK